MNYEMFIRLSLRSLINALMGHRKNQESQDREAWERSRFTVFYLMNIQMDRKDRFKTFQDLVCFPWEEKKQKRAHKLTASEFENIINNG